MQHHSYPSLAAWLACGTRDHEVRAAQARVAGEARTAGMATVARLIPGGHEWSVWSAALRELMPWLWNRIGP